MQQLLHFNLQPLNDGQLETSHSGVFQFRRRYFTEPEYLYDSSKDGLPRPLPSNFFVMHDVKTQL